ncbi:MAG: hypothetical protein H6Q72_3843 [Firmicutes bacterium]|nr:hypothetical protein [Bacillota bacterium]
MNPNLQGKGVEGRQGIDRYDWILAIVRPIELVPEKGRQRLWEWEG